MLRIRLFSASFSVALLCSWACSEEEPSLGRDIGNPSDLGGDDAGGGDMSECTPMPEVCDGLDDDCSGQPDDGLDCGQWSGDGSDGEQTIEQTVDLDDDPRPEGSDGFGVSYRISSIEGDLVTVGDPARGLAPGDEVLLISLRGTSDDFATVGAFETRFVDSVDEREVTLRNPVEGVYGLDGGNADLQGQSVMLQRIPHFLRLEVTDGGVVTSRAFDGGRGGVVFVRTQELEIQAGGRIDMSHRGFRATNVAANGRMGRTGESISGQPEAVEGQAPLANSGAGQGGTSDCDVFNCTTRTIGAGGGGASYGSQGMAGEDNGDRHVGGSPGALYGEVGLERLYLGSAGGSGAGGVSGPGTSTLGGNGGGMVVIVADDVVVNGLLTVDGQIGVVNDNCGGRGGGGGGGGSGGTIWLSANVLQVAADALSAVGGGAQCNGGGPGGDGRIRIDASAVNGSSYGTPEAQTAIDAASTPDPGAFNDR